MEFSKKELWKHEDVDYEEWKRFYEALTDKAGMSIPEGRTSYPIKIQGYPFGLSVEVFLQDDPVAALKIQQELSLKNKVEPTLADQKKLVKAREVTGFFGIGAMGKKQRILTEELITKYGIDPSSVESLNATLDTALHALNEEVKLDQKWQEVLQFALEGAEKIKNINKRTQLNAMWVGELHNYVAEKLREMAS